MAHDAHGQYTEMEGKRSVVIDRCERYAAWTLPSIFPLVGVNESTELQNDTQSFGAQAVNHLSNKLMIGLFGPARPFFRMEMNEKMKVVLAENGITDDAGQNILQNAEQEAVKELDRMGAREPFTMTLQNLIITGNALLYFPKEDDMEVYTLRNYVVKRDLKGFPFLMITKDEKLFESFSPDVQFKILASTGKVTIDDKTEIQLYTNVRWDYNKKKYIVTQEAEGVQLLDKPGIYTKENCPFIPLVWKLVRGEDYGRGLVEDYSGDFHSLSVTEESMLEMIGILAQIKGLVNPVGMTDVSELNEAPNGQWCSGREEDVSYLQSVELAQSLQVLQGYADKKERRLSKAFLMDAAGVRDAERVTAEEIRLIARDLEMALGGVYTRLAQIFQLPVARLLLQRIDFKLGTDFVEPIIVTGLDALSRSGDLESFRMFAQDVSVIGGIDPEVRAEMDIPSIIKFLAINNNLDTEMALKSIEQKDQEAEQQAAQQEQAIQGEIRTKAAPQLLAQDNEAQ